MTNLNDRKDAFENKFAHDEQLKFKAAARRNKLLGLWAAELMGKSGDAAADYANRPHPYPWVRGRYCTTKSGSCLRDEVEDCL